MGGNISRMELLSNFGHQSFNEMHSNEICSPKTIHRETFPNENFTSSLTLITSIKFVWLAPLYVFWEIQCGRGYITIHREFIV